MKKLLGVIGVLALAAALLPAQGFAGNRGSFDLVTNGVPLVNGADQPALRPVDADGIMVLADPLSGGRPQELFLTFTSRSLVPNHEHVRTIYQMINLDQAFLRGAPLNVLLTHPTAEISYFDPAWSYDGRFLAYVQANADGSGQTLYVQEYAVSDDDFVADDAIGSPILVTSVGGPRRPNWHPSQHTLAFSANTAGTFDIYTIDVDVVGGTVSGLTRRTLDDVKAETAPSWAPNGFDIAYATNKFGPTIIEIVNTGLPSSDPGYTRLAETNFSFVSHNNPDWTSDGADLYYDAPTGEEPAGVTAVWKINLATQAKCEISLDIRADADPKVSGIVNTTIDGIPYNSFVFFTQVGGGSNIWRGNPVNSCTSALPMGVVAKPSTLNLNSSGNQITTIMQFPPETKALGYVCRQGNVGGEGVRNRPSLFSSPTLLGIATPFDPDVNQGAGPNGFCKDTADTIGTDPLILERTLTCFFDRRTIAERIVALGLLGQVVPMKMTAYSNLTGRPFQGFAYIKLTKSSQAGSAVTLLGNSPNPFNPVTRVKFAVEKAGTYAVRLYNVQGALVRTIANRHYAVGTHEATWDGRTATGGKAASGIYFAKVFGKDEASNSLRLVLAK